MRSALYTSRRCAIRVRPQFRRSPAGQWTCLRFIAETARRHDEGSGRKDWFQGYRADLLDQPLLPPRNVATIAPTPLPVSSNAYREETLAKARAVFGSRSDAEERQRELESRSQWIAGVLVPPKPEEPDNCCMSGCVNCVWERFREEMEEWAAKSMKARRKLIEQRTRGTATGLMGQPEADGVPSHTMISMDDDGGGSETNWTTAPDAESYSGAEESTDPLAGIPVGIREFMKTEKKLKARHRAAGEVIDTALDKELRANVWGAGT